MDLPPAPTPPTGNNTMATDRTSNLLNLLKFSGSNSAASTPQQSQQQPQSQQSPPQQQQPQSSKQQTDDEPTQHQQQPSTASQGPTRIHQPAPGGADPSGLLAALMRGAHEPEEPKPSPPAAAEPPTNGWRRSGSPPADTRSLLLDLLNRPKPSQTETLLTKSTDQSPKPAEQQLDSSQYYAQQSPQQAESRNDPRQAVANDALSFQTSKESQDNDISAFYQLMGKLAQSSPHQANTAAAQNPAPALHILKKDGASPAAQHSREHSQSGNGERSAAMSPQDRARQAINRSASYQSARQEVASPATAEQGQPVASAVDDLAGKADRDAREALERAEHQHPSASAAADSGSHDDSKYGHRETDRVAAEALHHMRVIVDDGQGVADSWESADQDEIVVIEEPEIPPVKVSNFPMKPWISITLQDGTNEQRPQFRDETIMDIARLKKEFDQVDRNLYTASQNYMTYGMSKHGGLRVIRQDDGKDAKVFTDTKDRIFNVSMSVTPGDHEGPQKEAIIGTGISGTVYWVQIKDGQKDHIDDAHLEQHGFALPPVASQDGEAPGGALKTRARASTSHPEYFAMGRGKCIHFIWPSYILQNNLFKPGHDRVADTETLLKECSLKINTGKAGKDFTFSQDDSVVVSLDKSGRVKFWDVRDLTAASSDSTSRHPLPAHTSLEVKEPLMTLASTPEGEKAWPTSVLLLDKQRPYQKRCALRYMIVGMKQNHTLQLWDLALGKPVQEFNLPHSKESDAVCSVMYHPASGMIVIGHPTRNSIYFAHLSAPKYNLKSVSQAEYIQRLVAQDSSIPQPDSTAVISGIREYSFANRGVLRSLDILPNPAMLQDADEPTLFELYAMHSKGVACLLIKQHELGWSKDNKVLHAVDAVDQGLVTVSKLKTPQPAEIPAESRNGSAANRAAGKDSIVQTTPAQSDGAQRGPESVTPVKVKGDGKDSASETPVQSSKEGHQSDKAERKSRKKKGKDAEQAPNGSATSRDAGSGKTETAHGQSTTVSTDALDAAIATLESRLSTGFSDTLKTSLRTLQGKLDDGARVRDESFNQHQLKLLDMVSQVLNENTQQVLETFIRRQFTELVIPAIGDRAHKSVSEVVNNKLQPTLVSTIQKEVQNAVPQVINRSLRSGELVNSIADRVGPSVASGLQQELVGSLVQRLTPALSNVAAQSAQRVASDVHSQYHEQIEQMRSQQRADASKIDQLLSHVARLTETMNSMASSQASMQTEFQKFKQTQVHELPAAGGSSLHMGGGVGSGAGSIAGSQGYGNQMGGASGNVSANQHHQHQHQHQHSYPPSQAPSQTQPYLGSPHYAGSGAQQHARSPLESAQASEHVGPASTVSALTGAYANQMNRSDAEADNDVTQRIRLIETAIQDGRLQDAVIQWVQSGREEEIFRRCLSRYPPNKFAALPPLMLLVVIATISKDLKASPRLKEEVDWIEMAVRSFGEGLPNYEWEKQGHREVMRSASQTMQLLVNRIQPLTASIHNEFPTDPFLMKLDRGKLDWIVRSSQHILDAFTPRRYE